MSFVHVSVSSQKAAEPKLPTILNESETEDHLPKDEARRNEILQRIRRAEKRKQKKLRALKPRKERPSYRTLIKSEKMNRKEVNKMNFTRLLEFYGKEQNPERLDYWLNCVYPGIDQTSPTICGIKKRLERYKNKILMETDPRDYGVEWMFTNSLVGNRYPEVIKIKRRFSLPPITNGSLTSSSSSVTSKDSSRSSTEKARKMSIGRLRKEPISAGEFLRGETPKRSSAGKADSLEDESSDRISSGNGSDKGEQSVDKTDKGNDRDETKDGHIQLDYLSLDTIEGQSDEVQERIKKISFQSPEDESDDIDTSRRTESTTEANKRRRSSLGMGTLAQRKKSLVAQMEPNRREQIEQLKAELLRVQKLKAEGREKEIDFDMYLQRKRTLALLMNDDESLGDFKSEEELKKSWEEVLKCKYIRGYEPPEMRAMEKEQLGEFVFWKGDYDEEEDFVKERKEKEAEEKEDAEVVDRDVTIRRKSVAELIRKPSLPAINLQQ